MNKKVIISLILVISLLVLTIISALSVNAYVKFSGGKKIISADEAANMENVDCIIILGCGVRPSGKPSLMLSDRLDCGIDLYKNGASPKILMSGDHGREGYDEVNTMKQIAISEGVPSGDVFMDHAGFSTYESMYRAKEIFKADKVLIVSQKYHLYRALYIAGELGIEACGVATDSRIYGGETYREVREIFARCKDFLKVIFKPEPTFLGETIPVSGNGNLTND